jgi:hypothetical protein
MAGSPNLKFDEGIRQEHCEKTGHDTEFITSNYGLTTTPEKEYQIALTGKFEGKDIPKRDLCDKSGRNQVRFIKPLHDLEKLPVVRESKLKRYEILSVVSSSAKSIYSLVSLL